MAGRQLNPVQHRKALAIEKKAEEEKLTRKESSMAKARSALAATYAKYGIKPYVEKPLELPKRTLVLRKQLTPEERARLEAFKKQEARS